MSTQVSVLGGGPVGGGDPPEIHSDHIPKHMPIHGPSTLSFMTNPWYIDMSQFQCGATWVLVSEQRGETEGFCSTAEPFLDSRQMSSNRRRHELKHT